MTIDERLAALAARHEALVMSLELFSREVEALRTPVERLVAVTENLVKVAQQDGENGGEYTRAPRIIGSADTYCRNSREANQ